jgi:hypothetical protein
MKDFYSDYGYNFIKILKDKEVPSFVKEADMLDQEEMDRLPDTAFASVDHRKLPITDPANVYVSAAYYFNANEKNAEVEDRILKAAELFEISEEIKNILPDTNTKIAQEDNQKESTWEISATYKNGNIKKFAGDSSSIEKFQDEFVSKVFNLCSFESKMDCAEKIAQELEKSGKEVSHRILEISGRNIPNLEKVAEQVKARAVRLPKDSQKVSLCKLADELLDSSDKTIDGMKKLAKILESIDEENSLTRFYNNSILDPFASVFNTNINDAKKIASVIDLNGSEFSVEELSAVDKDILKLALSKESLDIIGMNTDSFDALKIANISEEDKVNLALYL